MADYTAKKISDMEGFYQGLFLKARDELGVRSFGLAVVEIDPEHEHPDHAHPGGQEEVYVVLEGTGTLEIDGGAERIALDADTLVRVGPDTKRRIVAEGGRMRLLAIGGTPGEAYDAPGYSEVGAPDPMG